MNTQPNNAENGEKKILGNPEVLKINEQAKKYAESCELIPRVESEVYFAFKQGASWMASELYTPEQVFSMLEALRQRCALNCDNRELSLNAHKNRILSIDLNKFLQK